MYKCIVFDMDGTLVNSYQGIYQAYKAAFERMGRKWKGDSFVRRAIGAPLPFVFGQLCGMRQEEVLRAIGYYRAYYGEKGWRELQVYPGIKETLQELRRRNYFLGIATLKKEKFAEEILKEQGIFSYFDVVCGMDEQDRFAKSDLIRRCMEKAGAQPGETILIGDSEFDAQGAKQAGVDFLAVTYGFGFSDKEACRRENIQKIAESPADILLQIEALSPECIYHQ